MKSNTRNGFPLWIPKDPSHPGTGKKWMIIETNGVKNYHRLTDWPDISEKRRIPIWKFNRDFKQDKECVLPIDYHQRIFEIRK